jgi:hypothetical protein
MRSLLFVSWGRLYTCWFLAAGVKDSDAEPAQLLAEEISVLRAKKVNSPSSTFGRFFCSDEQDGRCASGCIAGLVKEAKLFEASLHIYQGARITYPPQMTNLCR